MLRGGIFDDTYNLLQYNVEFKNETKRAVLITQLAERNEISIALQVEINKCKENFTMKKLLQCNSNYFSLYIKKYGDKQPVQTSYSWVNSGLNSLLSYSHFVRTNQPFAKRIVKIIEEAKENKHETKAVFEALIQIKDVHNEMIKKNISGEVRKGIEKTLEIFELDITKVGFNKQAEELSELIDYKLEPDKSAHKKSRIQCTRNSPILERTLLKSY